MRVAKNNSHIALLQFAYCRLSFRILLIFYRNVFFTPSRRCCRADFLEYLADENLLKESSIIFLFDKKL